MQLGTDVGKIEQLFEWFVPLTGFWQDHVDVCYKSPHFQISDSTWYMTFGTKHKGWIGLFLNRVDSGLPINIKYTLGIDTTGDYKTFRKTHIFKRSDSSSGEPMLIKLSEMNPSFHKGPHQVKITCRIYNYSADSLQETPNSVCCEIQREGPESVSCVNQTESLDSVPCVNETEIPNNVSRAIETGIPDSGTEEEHSGYGDWSLLDKKANPNSVSCGIQTEFTNSVSCANQTEILNSVSHAIQTEISDSVSCAIQTEISYSGSDKENSEEDWSSLDRKEVKILRDRMKDLLTERNDHDVTIYVQEKEFRAHRSILSARSPAFAMMLTHDTKENNTGTIDIEDCDSESFDEFLLYVYCGRTENLSPRKALQLYYTADKYDFPVLKERCVSLLKNFLSVTSICDVILLAAKHQEKELLRVATEFFARNVKQILSTVGWQNFMSQNPVEANELYIKSIEFLRPDN